MRRRPGGPLLILALAIITSPAPFCLGADPTKPEKIELGGSYTYQTLGKLPMMHEGRIKPLDTVARQEIKSIYTRETITLTSPDGKTVTSWSPAAAYFDWSVRPKYWDDQPIIAVEYLPLKRLLLAGEIKGELEIIAGKAATSADDQKRIKDLIAEDEIDASDLRTLVRASKLEKADALTIEKLASKVGEETRWLSPNEFETADLMIDGKKMSWGEWIQDIMRRTQGGPMMSSTTKPTELERKAEEVAVRLVHYRSIRDREPFGPAPLLVTPRPTNPAMLQFSFKSLEKGAPTQGRDLSPLEFESAKNLSQYYEDLDSKDRAEPGTNAKFDAKYSRWLAERSVWVPLGVVLETPTEELGRAGFDTSKVEKFRTAFKAMEAEELTNPGRALEQPAIDLIQAARDLGDTTNDPYYPTIAEMDREVHYNELAPFNKSTVAYGIGFLALMFSLLTTSFGKSVNLESVFGKLAKAFYLAGFVGLASGIAFEGYGFYLRIRITGWAPVTNMAETVIWVGLVSAVLGTVLELIYRRTWSAMAGSGIGLICTALVAAAPLLDPHIKMLPPVLRSNLWLSIHVLTIVSSYAAFALAMGLGLAATSLYLTATYKRSASFVELAMPMVLGLPMLGVGILGSLTYYEWVNPGSIVQVPGFWLGVVIIGSIGGTLTASSLFAMVGESLNRSIFREQLGLDSATSTDDLFLAPASPPIVPPKTDASTATRQLAMQTTAAQIKPIASFIYRSMQVGILLVTAGTFLGGWWADVSWGRFWGWDPKEVWALITLLVYLVPLHGRFAGWVNTFWLVMASVVCFLSVVMAWYGVNFLLGTGLHNYGFTEGAGQGKVGVTLLVVLSFAFGTAWRRMLSQKVVEAVA